MAKLRRKVHLEIAEMKDAESIRDLIYPSYFDESIYRDLTYDPDMTLNVIKGWLRDRSFIVKDSESGKVVGFATIAFLRSFYKETEGDVEMFYVLPEYRGTWAARLLVNCLVENARANDAKVIYTSCLSGIDEKNNTLYVNLWKKFGFKTLGTVLIGS